MNQLYGFDWSFRAGRITGLFLATKEEIESAIGRTVDFGEALGKHSEITGELETGDFEMINVSDDFIEEFEGGVGSHGYNPLDYLMCSDCGCPDDDCECAESKS